MGEKVYIAFDEHIYSFNSDECKAKVYPNGKENDSEEFIKGNYITNMVTFKNLEQEGKEYLVFTTKEYHKVNKLLCIDCQGTKH